MRDIDLKFFEEILVERRKQIEKNIKEAQKELQSLKEVEVNDDGDYASISCENLIESAITTHQSEELVEILEALEKIKKGTYGICEMCEEPIGYHRLKVKPRAKYCIVCREIAEKNGK